MRFPTCTITIDFDEGRRGTYRATQVMSDGEEVFSEFSDDFWTSWRNAVRYARSRYEIVLLSSTVHDYAVLEEIVLEV